MSEDEMWWRWVGSNYCSNCPEKRQLDCVEPCEQFRKDFQKQKEEAIE